MAARKKASEDKQRKKCAEFDMEVDKQDELEVEEQEAVAYQQQKKAEELYGVEEAAKMAGDTTAQSSSFGKGLANAFGAKIAATRESMAKQQAEEDAARRRRANRDNMHKMREELDSQLDSSSLIAQMKASDDALSRALQEDKEMQDKKLEQRKALLRARRKNKKQAEQEEERIKETVDILEEEAQEKQEINEAYLRKMFKRPDGADTETKEEKKKRLDLLNEYLSDQFLERLS